MNNLNVKMKMIEELSKNHKKDQITLNSIDRVSEALKEPAQLLKMATNLQTKKKIIVLISIYEVQNKSHSKRMQ